MDKWPFWMLEENIKIVNEIVEEEDKQRKQDEQAQNVNMPDTNAMRRNAGSLTNNIPKF
jgi:hypothetical protein